MRRTILSEDEQAVSQEVEQKEAEKSPDLTIQDLSAIKSIIDISCQRGAFKPGEMAAVGQTYNKLEAFLKAVLAQQDQGA